MMMYQLLLVLLLAGCAHFEATELKNEIKVVKISGGIELSCSSKGIIYGNGMNGTEIQLQYRDDISGEYQCEGKNAKIYVKFRTCDNCVELDTFSIAGLAVGDVVATIVVGVAVYLIASNARAGQVQSTTRKPDSQGPSRGERPGEGNYQQLNFRRGGKSEYDVLHKQ